MQDKNDHAALMQAALEIAAAGAKVSASYFNSVLDIEIKADESPVTAADRETEKAIRAAIEERFPGDGIFGEEFGKTQTESDRLWIIDPIDGTKSFITGVPLYGLLLGVLEQGMPTVGLIGMPSLGETYHAIAGQGAWLNGTPIQTTRTCALSDATIFVNEAPGLYRQHPDLFARLLEVGKLCRLAYDCYPHALLAAGRIDAVIDYGLMPYDYLPVLPVVEAAGGVMTDWSGAPLGMESDGRTLGAATPELHAALLELLKTA